MCRVFSECASCPEMDFALLCKPIWWNTIVSQFSLVLTSLGEWCSPQKYLREWHSLWQLHCTSYSHTSTQWPCQQVPVSSLYSQYILKIDLRGLSLNQCCNYVFWENQDGSLNKSYAFCILLLQHRSVPSVLWRCWLGGRKGIQPVNKTSPKLFGKSVLLPHTGECTRLYNA